MIIVSINVAGRYGMMYCCAAVADFFVPHSSMTTHKIQVYNTSLVILLYYTHVIIVMMVMICLLYLPVSSQVVDHYH
jgi:hypothetical protein